MTANQLKIAVAFENLHLLSRIPWNRDVICRCDIQRQRCLVVTHKIIMAFDRHVFGSAFDKSDFNGVAFWKISLADVVGFDLVRVSRFENMKCHKGRTKTITPMIADHDWSAVMPVAPVGLAGKDSTGRNDSAQKLNCETHGNKSKEKKFYKILLSFIERHAFEHEPAAKR